MIEKLENERIRIEPSDWRWSAAIVGISKYFDFLEKEGSFEKKLVITDEYIEFDPNEITEESYLLFVENFFSENMHHLKVEDLLEIEEWTEDQNKQIVERLKANTIMKNSFKGVDIKNKEKLKDIIDKNRLEIIKQTYKGGRALYYNFCNENNLFTERGKSCRVRGYSIDMGKKGKSTGFMRDKNSFVYTDSKYFDFIPFAFSKSREAFFINNNFTIGQLINSNKNEIIYTNENRENTIRSDLFFRTKESSNFIDYDVEIVKKDRENEYFETIYLRDEAIRIFEKIDAQTQKAIKRSIKITDKNYWSIEYDVVSYIINLLNLDNIIEKLLKLKENYLIDNLIKINIIIYNKGGKMKEEQLKKIKQIRAITYSIRETLPSNKVRGYEQRLISAISLKDYDRVQEILLHLSATTQIKMEFLIDLFTDFEGNKNLAYSFINLLGEKKDFRENKGDKK